MTKLSRYYRVIHPTLPLLPDTKTTLFQQLDKVSVGVREAFEATLQTLLQDSLAKQQDDFSKSPKGLISILIIENRVKSYLDGIVCLQTILLLIVIPTFRAQKDYNPQALYGLANAVVSMLGLGLTKTNWSNYNILVYPCQEIFADAEVKSYRGLARRAWLAFMVVEHWSAAAKYIVTTSLGRITDMFADDEALLQPTGFYIARKSPLFFPRGECSWTHKPRSNSHFGRNQ